MGLRSTRLPYLSHLGSQGDLSYGKPPDHPDVLNNVPSGMVEIEPEAFGLNFRDVMVELGQLDETLICHDGAGKFTRVGPDTERLKVGDRVCGIFKGFFASTERPYRTSVTKIPDNISWQETAPIPFVFGTAYIASYEIARLKQGESILIHGSTGRSGRRWSC